MNISISLGVPSRDFDCAQAAVVGGGYIAVELAGVMPRAQPGVLSLMVVARRY